MIFWTNYLGNNNTDNTNPAFTGQKQMGTYKTQYGLKVTKPVLRSSDADKMSYEIAADELVKNDDHYLLSAIKGSYYFSNDKCSISASSAHLNSANKNITLHKNVLLDFQGFNLSSEEIYINLVKKTISTDSPVYLHFNNNLIKAGSVQVDVTKQLIKMNDGVVSKIKLQGL